MRFTRTEAFKRDFRGLDGDSRGRVEAALLKMAENPRHPSLRTRKMEGRPDIWEARASRTHGITFHWEGEDIILRRVGTHDVLRRP